MVQEYDVDGFNFEAMVQFIQRIAGINDDYIDLAVRNPHWNSRFPKVNQLANVQPWLEENWDKDFYYSPATFSSPQRSQKYLKRLKVIKADYDVALPYRKSENPCFQTMEDAMGVEDRLLEIGLNPVIVNSGGGVHAYIIVDENIADMPEDEYQALSEALFKAGLGQVGNPNSFNETKHKNGVMRLPGTFNTKAGGWSKVVSQGQPMRLDEVKSALKDFIELKTERALGVPSSKSNGAICDLGENPQEFKAWATDHKNLFHFGNKNAKYKSRSDKEEGIIVHLLVRGLTVDEIKAFFEAYMKQGSHYFEHADKDGYLFRSIGKAQEYIDNNPEACFDWWDTVTKKVDFRKLISWFDRDFLKEFGDDIAMINGNLMLFDGRIWIAATDKAIEEYLIGYFDGYRVSLSMSKEIPELVKRFKIYGNKKNLTLDLTGKYRENIIVSFVNGTLLIQPGKLSDEGILGHEFQEGFWNKSDHVTFYVKEPYDEAMWSMDISDSIVGRFLDEYFTDNARVLLGMFCGSVLVPNCRPEKAVMMISPGRSGKNTFTNALASLFNEGAVSYVEMEDFGERFKNIGLANSILNVSSEIDSRKKSCVKALKQMISGDDVLIESKFKDAYVCRPQSKYIFLANSYPDFPPSFAVSERFEFIKQTKTPKKRTIAFKERFMADRGYLLAFMIQGLQAFINNGFELPSGDDVYDEWLLSAHTLGGYILDRLDIGQDKFCYDGDLFEDYKKWAEVNLGGSMAKQLTRHGFTKALNDCLGSKYGYVEKTNLRKVIDGVKQSKWVGIGIKNDDDDSENTNGTELF